MIIEDFARAERKLSQVGYYRLSGYWYICREIIRDQNNEVLFSSKNIPARHDQFIIGTSFDTIFDLYLFDKKLRQLMLDAIERIEVYIRSIIAHELGFSDPLAYKKEKFIHPKFQKPYNGKPSSWEIWSQKQTHNISKSKEDCIRWHINQQRDLPFWVVVETWDFGTTSHYFKMLNGKYQNKVAQRLSLNPKDVKKIANWLQEINILRNRCAHHSRIWNQNNNNALNVLSTPYFERLNLDQKSREKIFGIITVLWFLICKMSNNSDWILQVADLINSSYAKNPKLK
ncbi:Abi family protein [Candidatus Albibeggiatoa sp. nov. BB20]|uniref:Abi family protein n=1 Tax=Candidatus Albibeggiatoa sp. nov. BB20 TaxID=3162723 RepID=UPI003365323B